MPPSPRAASSAPKSAPGRTASKASGGFRHEHGRLKSTVAKQPKKLGGIDFTGAQYGSCLAVVFGKNKVSGNVGWYGDFRAISHKEKQPGKGGGAKSNTTYTYSASFQIMICEGDSSIAQVYDSGNPKSLATVGGIAFTGTTPPDAVGAPDRRRCARVRRHLAGVFPRPRPRVERIAPELHVRDERARTVRRRDCRCEPSRHHHDHCDRCARRHQFRRTRRPDRVQQLLRGRRLVHVAGLRPAAGGVADLRRPVPSSRTRPRGSARAC